MWVHTYVNMLVQGPGRGRQERPRRWAHGHVSVLAPFEPQLPETPSLTIPASTVALPSLHPRAGPNRGIHRKRLAKAEPFLPPARGNHGFPKYKRANVDARFRPCIVGYLCLRAKYIRLKMCHPSAPYI